ncbi:IS66 family transposase [Candidatus Thiodictyon syntrophicum]|uniref:IS66 family transposase n=1 Tax=Candidatus Thiodictyon syntrophicum TaxID=1166950 RepID=UPI001F1A38A8|nr:transposase [Candidatus Thiodictyon syntrophicum]
MHVTGVAPLQAQVYTLERLRCGLCGTVFTAEPPAGVGAAKYDATAAAMIALLKYGCGLPFHRIQRLEQALAIPLPATTQWDVVAAAAPCLTPAVEELARQAAQGTVLYNDDTTMRILKFTAEARAEALPPGANAEHGQADVIPAWYWRLARSANSDNGGPWVRQGRGAPTLPEPRSAFMRPCRKDTINGWSRLRKRSSNPGPTGCWTLESSKTFFRPGVDRTILPRQQEGDARQQGQDAGGQCQRQADHPLEQGQFGTDRRQFDLQILARDDFRRAQHIGQGFGLGLGLVARNPGALQAVGVFQGVEDDRGHGVLLQASVS